MVRKIDTTLIKGHVFGVVAILQKELRLQNCNFCPTPWNRDANASSRVPEDQQSSNETSPS
ncbi:hypothetical protein RO3G_04429 [Rhizopus delemar RA 99-880]|uniref:Uncharacterized protein n=1 Tax=Rhizopus delemar (strain RA 99-880 / ATCC MYA-4621 / FGSC 9543 / NRRL 43880) TaxID=246409 RepID=I1BU44_RHIO9|nr:hypothetical protein RO3G_04429 [Rhizopus delemar RA 99-880]|eukprot:EIE79724.1 hypothetical protein RO3G_04429 [Rhizopus delemar RA 99-880]